MSVGGWIFMSCSILFVLSLCTYCFRAILTKPSASDHLHAPQTIDTGDEDT